MSRRRWQRHSWGRSARGTVRKRPPGVAWIDDPLSGLSREGVVVQGAQSKSTAHNNLAIIQTTPRSYKTQTVSISNFVLRRVGACRSLFRQPKPRAFEPRNARRQSSERQASINAPSSVNAIVSRLKPSTHAFELTMSAGPGGVAGRGRRRCSHTGPSGASPVSQGDGLCQGHDARRCRGRRRVAAEGAAFQRGAVVQSRSRAIRRGGPAV